MLDTMTGTLAFLLVNIYLKYIPIHIHNFEHTSVIMNMNIIQPWLPVSQKCK